VSTVQAILDDIYQSTGGRNDSVVQSLALRGVNMALMAATLLFKPSTQRTSGIVTATSSSSYVSLSPLTRWLVVEEVYNTESNSKVWYSQFNELDILPVTGSSVLIYSVYGNDLYYRPQPSTDENLRVYYLSYPDTVTATDSLPFTEGRDFVYNFTQTFVWAALEEGDAAGIWARLSNAMGNAYQELTSLRDALQRQEYGNYLQTAVPKSPAAV